jgi:hypothetical protein
MAPSKTHHPSVRQRSSSAEDCPERPTAPSYRRRRPPIRAGLSVPSCSGLSCSGLFCPVLVCSFVHTVVIFWTHGVYDPLVGCGYRQLRGCGNRTAEGAWRQVCPPAPNARQPLRRVRPSTATGPGLPSRVAARRCDVFPPTPGGRQGIALPCRARTWPGAIASTHSRLRRQGHRGAR